MMHTREEQLQAFSRLLDVMDDLREKCPWDRKQTFDSLRENTIEECYELTSAIIKKDMTEVSKELGDVLLHVVFYAKMGSESGEFDIADVCNRLCDKLIFRHPHVYGEEAAKNAEDVTKLWEQVKLREKGGNKTVLSGVPESLPTLVKAYRVQEKAANVGFDWEKREDVWEKVKEEIAELESELNKWKMEDGKCKMEDGKWKMEDGKWKMEDGKCKMEDGKWKMEDGKWNIEEAEGELGDLLFALINMARLYKLRPDNALERTNQKFIRRFGYIEQKAAEQGRALKEMSLEEMDALWNEAKRIGL